MIIINAIRVEPVKLKFVRLFLTFYYQRFDNVWTVLPTHLILHVFCQQFYFRDGDKMVPSVEKKIAELEMGLLHLQQNIDIPEISLAIHPVVTAMAKKTAEEGRRPKVQDFGDKVEDSTFLNQLQNGVNRWIREIQKVCMLLIRVSPFSTNQSITVVLVTFFSHNYAV